MIAILTTNVGFTQTGTKSGAKALFFTPESGQTIPFSSRARGSANLPSEQGEPNGKPLVIGLRCSIELKQPDGSLRRVSPTRVFHSGDRIRLHVTSNVNGNLVIYQKQEDLPEERLFPDTRVPDAAGKIERGIDVVLPSAHAWFQFDDRPGQILLTLLLIANGNEIDSHALPATPETAHQLVTATSGSKALRVEIESTDDNAEYKVVDSRLDTKLPAGEIATEVVLSHAR